MADTGAPWNLPYPLPTDLVRDGAQAIQDLAEATADSLGLVAVKHALKTDTFSAALGGGEDVAVPGLSITHEVADENNLLIISAYFGAAANSQGRGQTGIAVMQGTTLIGVGTDVGERAAVGAGGRSSSGTADSVVSTPSVMFVHLPGSGSHVYTVRAINIAGPNTVYVNRNEQDTDVQGFPRAASALVIQEVAV